MAPDGAERPVVVSIGGSILVPKEHETEPIKRIARILAGCARRKKILVTVGGGATARDYIRWGRSLAATERMLDGMGIQITRVNALLLIGALQGLKCAVNRTPPHTVPAAIRESRTKRIVVMGGTVPGHTTDAVAAMLARAGRCSRVVNATSVDGVYSSDPRSDPSARRFEKMSYQDLLKLVDVKEWRAGPNVPFDAKGVRILAKARIPLAVVKGTDLTALEAAIAERPFDGTLVS